ncbi:hypothetical protein SO802_021291 [Lithocarpus litseifolius]|uniref:Uncharacterized protein n=1 Tax=Lithocarpus litseifolius TaxID=425828 RepID=A0AAW2CEF9_9ROSI
MFVKMALRLNHFGKMENLAMRANHPLATYGEIFMIVLNAEKKPMMTIIQEGRKNLPNKVAIYRPQTSN